MTERDPETAETPDEGPGGEERGSGDPRTGVHGSSGYGASQGGGTAGEDAEADEGG